MTALCRSANVRREAAEWSKVGLENDMEAMRSNLAAQLVHVQGVKGTRPGPPGAFKRPQRFPQQIDFRWRFCVGAQGA